jgi:hypothetical protein
MGNVCECWDCPSLGNKPVVFTRCDQARPSIALLPALTSHHTYTARERRVDSCLTLRSQLVN